MPNAITGVVSFTAPWDAGRPSVVTMAAFVDRMKGWSVPSAVVNRAWAEIPRASAEGRRASGRLKAGGGEWGWDYDPTPTPADLSEGCGPRDARTRRPREG